MNELMILFLENDWLMYGVWGAAATGCLIQIILSVIYSRSLSASDRMRSTKLLWLKQMKTRFESGYEWNNRIRNVELFVEKNIGRRKWMGIYLKTWERLGQMMIPVILLFVSFETVIVAVYRQDTVTAMIYLTYGVLLTVFLYGVTVFANLKEKQSLLRTNLCDYFENTLQAEARRRYRGDRRAQEEYFGVTAQQEIACTETVETKGSVSLSEEEEEKKQTVQEGTKTTYFGSNPDKNQGENKKEQRKEKKQEQKLSKKSAKVAKKENRLQKKQERKAAKEEVRLQKKQKKEQKRVAKLTRRMAKMQQRMGTAVTAELQVTRDKTGNAKEENARQKREQLKRKVDITPAQEDQIISEVLREFLA